MGTPHQHTSHGVTPDTAAACMACDVPRMIRYRAGQFLSVLITVNFVLRKIGYSSAYEITF